MTYERDFDLTQLRWTTEATAAFWRAFEARSPPGRSRARSTRSDGRGPVRPGASRRKRTSSRRPAPTRSTPKITRNPQPLVFPIRRTRVVDGPDGWLQAVRELDSQIPEVALVDGGQSLALPEQPSPARVRRSRARPCNSRWRSRLRGRRLLSLR